MNYPGGPKVTTGVLVSERGRPERQRRRHDDRSRDWSDVTIGFEDEKEPQAKECGQSLEAGKARKWIFT